MDEFFDPKPDNSGKRNLFELADSESSDDSLEDLLEDDFDFAPNDDSDISDEAESPNGNVADSDDEGTVDLFEYAESHSDENKSLREQNQPEGKDTGAKKGKKSRIVKRLLIVAGTLVLVLAILVAAAAGVFMHFYNKLDYVTDSDSSSYYINSIDESQLISASYVKNILLIGTDERTSDFSANARADSMIICSINSKTKTISLVSLERGMTVQYLSSEDTYSSDLLTHVFKHGGAGLLINTIESTFNIKIDGYVRVNFNAFEQIIDILGGVDVELTQKEATVLMSGDNNAGQIDKTLVEGTNHLTGSEALIYSRLRSIDSDWGRVKRQRKVLIAIKEKLTDCSLSELINLANEILPLVRTNITSTSMLGLIWSASFALANDIQQTTVPVKDTYTSLGSVDFEANAEFLKDYLY